MAHAAVNTRTSTDFFHVESILDVLQVLLVETAMSSVEVLPQGRNWRACVAFAADITKMWINKEHPVLSSPG